MPLSFTCVIWMKCGVQQLLLLMYISRTVVVRTKHIALQSQAHQLVWVVQSLQQLACGLWVNCCLEFTLSPCVLHGTGLPQTKWSCSTIPKSLSALKQGVSSWAIRATWAAKLGLLGCLRMLRSLRLLRNSVLSKMLWLLWLLWQLGSCLSHIDRKSVV